MQANIGGIVPLSTVDWHGRSSVVVFFNGCSFRCPYCHNFDLIEKKNPVDMDLVQKRIAGSKPFVSAVVFLGGEPLLQAAEVEEIAKIAKENGLLVGIHTNGYFPKAVASLLEKKLADKIFVDIKAPFEPAFYMKVIGLNPEPTKSIPTPTLKSTLGPLENTPSDKPVIENIQKTLRLIDESDIELEIKTTVFPGLVGSPEDISKIAAWMDENLNGKTKLTYVLQQGNGKNASDPVLKKTRSFEPEEMTGLANVAKKYLKNVPVFTRTEEEGQKEIF
ncbi:anaerobic ribonucleoside-triphosphate reductase activating protein [Methanolapillus ohkumae]|uniref:7-carboxy-7-deazaguanine synthase n=1 Tax=Methanolapillus ohkumae TaxID=3028298 RepID=A0AA96V483_9EURY|nr:7-carboxy-7-deazaguanine synthase [Methanosarcinaceae archaeon Am2]